MKRRTYFSLVIVIVVLAALAPIPGKVSGRSSGAPISTAFTYQGTLFDGNAPAKGTYDLTFALYDALVGGARVGNTITRDDVSVANGLFTVELDFGAVFHGTALYLEICVRPSSGGNYVTLTPRQTLHAAPFARYAAQSPWAGLTDVPAGFADGKDDGATYTAGTGVSLNSYQINLIESYQLPQTCANGETPQWNGSSWGCASPVAYTPGTGVDLSSGQFSLQSSYQLPQTCANGETPQWNGSIWVCANAAAFTAGTGVNLSSGQLSLQSSYQLPQTCANGEMPQWNGSSWSCATAAAYTAGTGVDLSSGQFSLQASYQLPQTCANGETPQWNGSTWICVNYTAGTGLGLNSGQFGLLANYQLPQTCANGQVVQWNGSVWVCANDQSTTYTAGNGININSNTVSASYAGSGGDLGTANTLARSDHSHSNYLSTGESAGGDLTGSYPNPTIASDAVASAEISNNSVDMADTVNWMNSGEDSDQFSSTDTSGYIYLYGPSFTPSADGKCLVIANAWITSNSGAGASSGEPPQLDTILYKTSSGSVIADPASRVAFSYGDVTDAHPITAVATWVWNVIGGQTIQFGCRIDDPDGAIGTDWGSDEIARCRIAYICQ